MSNKLHDENTAPKKGMSKSTLAILIATGAVLLIAAIVFFAGPIIKLFKGNGNSDAPTTAGQVISVVDEQGNQQETIDTVIKVRDIKFGKNIKQVKKMEKKLDDTMDNPSTATSQDGYTYLTYSFNKEAQPEFFGATVSATSNTAMLVYVFYNDSLIEVRVQYGEIGETGYSTILSHNNNTYGTSTYSRAYSNGSKQSWWKTKDATLDVIYQNGEVMAYYRTNNK